jgi:hypothetical protein
VYHAVQHDRRRCVDDRQKQKLLLCQLFISSLYLYAGTRLKRAPY